MSLVASIVVPTFQRPDLLNRCLGALVTQNFPRDKFEIIVCDDGGHLPSAQDTRAVVAQIAEQSGIRMAYLAVTGNHGPAAARNQGWMVARGEIVAFTDDDTIADRNWLREGVMAFYDEEVVAASGRTYVPLPPTPTDYQWDASGLARAEFVTANCFCSKEALQRIGGFDERFTAPWREDSDLHFRLLAIGQVTQARRAVVIHPVRPASWGVSLKQVKKSYFNALLYKKHPRLYRARIQSRPPLRYYGAVLAILVFLAAVWKHNPGLMAATAAAWFIFVGTFFLKRIRHTSRAPLHLAEMAFTSVLIPELAVFWRLYGALRFRVLFL